MLILVQLNTSISTQGVNVVQRYCNEEGLLTLVQVQGHHPLVLTVKQIYLEHLWNTTENCSIFALSTYIG